MTRLINCGWIFYFLVLCWFVLFIYNCNSAEVSLDVQPEGGSVNTYTFFLSASECVCILFFAAYKVLNRHSVSKGTFLADHHIKVMFESEDVILKLRLELGSGSGQCVCVCVYSALTPLLQGVFSSRSCIVIVFASFFKRFFLLQDLYNSPRQIAN